MMPPCGFLPPQGWKVHASATLDNANAVLDAAWAYCVAREIPFKFISDPVSLLLRNSKYCDRASSGKFVTIYPEGLDEFECVLRELGRTLDGLVGPYILSDVRWGAGPLHVRYGGFIERYCKLDDGGLVLAISDPDGRLVPDVREPRFSVPDWVEIPGFLIGHIDARQRSGAASDFPFRVERPLHYSNGGGVYLATDLRTDRRVVLREARPLAGLDSTGHDAVWRLLRERDVLSALSGSGIVPDLYEHFTCWEHHFLVEEYIEGDTLNRQFVQRYPLIHPDVTDRDIAEYTQWALDLLAKIRRGLRALHDAGISFGDLHPNNIMVTPDREVKFIDLEAAFWLVDNQSPGIGAPGYVPPDGRRGAEVDLYALASLTLSLFLPLTVLLPLDPAKTHLLASSVAQRFPVPGPLLTDAVEVLRDRRYLITDSPQLGEGEAAELAAGIDGGTPDWPALRKSIQAAILSSATPERADRLFPGDIDQFSCGGIGVAYGAAGVLYALARSGAGRFPEHEQWLLAAARRSDDHRRVGFYDGLHGIAYVLAELGRREDALAVLQQVRRVPLDQLSTTLFDGLPGVGLNLLHFARVTGDSSLRAQALEAGSLLAQYLHGPVVPVRRRQPGLMFGFSGPALLYVRLFEATGDRQHLDLAEQALRRDLDGCVVMDDGTLLVDEGWRAEPYIATGSAGIGLVIQEFLRHRQNDDFAAGLLRIRSACEPEFVICPGLFSGRAGLMASAAWLASTNSPADTRTRFVIDRHLRRLAWHMVPYQGRTAFPGNQLLRLSMDFATGSAGVLWALNVVLDDGGPVLPFFSQR